MHAPTVKISLIKKKGQFQNHGSKLHNVTHYSTEFTVRMTSLV